MSSRGGSGSYSTTIAARAAASDFAVLRGDQGDGFADVAHDSPAASTGQSFWIIGMRFWPGMSAAVRTACTPGRCARGGHVEARDPGVRVRGAQDAGHERARHRRCPRCRGRCP